MTFEEVASLPFPSLPRFSVLTISSPSSVLTRGALSACLQAMEKAKRDPKRSPGPAASAERRRGDQPPAPSQYRVEVYLQVRLRWCTVRARVRMER